MSPLYHLQVGSFLANSRGFNLRERKFIMLASLAPDIDGIPGILNPDWMYLHHTFGHNVFFALLIGVAFAAVNRARAAELFLFCFLSAILQVMLDNLTNDASWQIIYFWPVWMKNFALGEYIHWGPLNTALVYGVQGTLMAAILGGTVYLYKRTGRTFLEVVSARLDRFLTSFVVLAFTARCEVCGERAFYRESQTGQALCGLHAKVGRGLTVERKPPSAASADN